MNRELSSCIRSPIEYSTLYERKPYIDQLCYLYWLVEDLINEIGKIESLYPSIEALKADQPCYADQAFQSTIKTLTLWLAINYFKKAQLNSIIHHQYASLKKV